MYIIIALVLISLIGLIIIRKELKAIIEKYNFVAEFTNKYQNFISKKSENTSENYDWLLHRVDRVQTYLGSAGLVSYKPPFSNYIIHNYSYVTEVINQLGSTSKPHIDDQLYVRNLLVRFSSNLDVIIDNERKKLTNPILWLRAGIQFVFSLPILILHLFGIFEYSNVLKFRNSNIVKILSSFASLIIILGTLLDALLKIANNWEFITDFISSIKLVSH
jgi:hypothetical protein